MYAIRSYYVADLKGARSPDGYVAQKIILNLIDAHLETAGLTRKDLKPVPVASVVAGANAFIAGKTDVFLFALGAPKVREAHAKIGIRALAIPNTPENLAKMRKHMPAAYFRREVPGKHVITSYSIHYTKLYECRSRAGRPRPSGG